MKASEVMAQLDRVRALEAQIAEVDAAVDALDWAEDHEARSVWWMVLKAKELRRVPQGAFDLVRDDVRAALVAVRNRLRAEADAVEIGQPCAVDAIAPAWLSRSAMERLIGLGRYRLEHSGDGGSLAYPCEQRSNHPMYDYVPHYEMWRRID